VIDMGQKLYPLLPLKWFCRFRYDSASKVSRLNIPKLFAHSPQDDLHSIRTSARSSTAPQSSRKDFVVLQGSHNDAAGR